MNIEQLNINLQGSPYSKKTILYLFVQTYALLRLIVKRRHEIFVFLKSRFQQLMRRYYLISGMSYNCQFSRFYGEIFCKEKRKQ